MADEQPQKLGLLAKLVLAFAAMMIVAGVVWHGITAATFQRIWHDMVERPSGPMAFRFILQPSMVAIVGIREGLRDARAGRAPYFWTMLRQPRERIGRLREGLNATARIILLGIAMDLIYQVLVLKTFYPNEALIIASDAGVRALRHCPRSGRSHRAPLVRQHADAA